MDVLLAQEIIKDQISMVKEEWMLKALFRFLGIDDKVTDSEFIKQYEAKLKPMTKEELIQHALEAEEDYKNGRFMDIDDYKKMTEKEGK